MPFDDIILVDYLKFHRIIFNCAGIWASDNKLHGKLVAMHLILMVCYAHTVLIFLLGCNNRRDFLLTFGIFAICIVFLGKILVTYFRRDGLIECKKLLSKAGFDKDVSVELTTNFELGFQEVAAQNDFLAKKYSYMIFLLFTVSVTFDIFFSYLGIMGYVVYTKIQGAADYKLPYNNWVPFDVNSDGSYVGAWCLQLYCNYWLSISFVLCDTHFFGLLVHLIYQVKTLKSYIAYLNRTISVRTPKDETFQKLKLYRAFRETQKVISIIEKIEDIYSMQLLHQVTVAIVLLTSFIQIFLEEPSIFMKVSQVVTLLTIAIEPLTIGWLCQTLTEELQDVANSIYSLDWYDFSPSYRKDLVFAIARLQKPVLITVGRFAPFDLGVFLNFMSKSYSIYTLLTHSRN